MFLALCKAQPPGKSVQQFVFECELKSARRGNYVFWIKWLAVERPAAPERQRGESPRKKEFVKKLSLLKNLKNLLIIVVVIAGIAWVKVLFHRDQVLRQVIDRLSADTRVAEVVVTKSELDEVSGKILTTIKFLEYNAKGEPLVPKYFTFRGNIIQFQSLVIRFNDNLIKKGDKLKGKSAYLFMKAFVLDPKDLQVFDITPAHTVPEGYQTDIEVAGFERQLWEKFWNYALNPQTRDQVGVKNAQIEAPGSLFLPGTIYTLKIEHDGGIRIDTQPIPQILKGEKIA